MTQTNQIIARHFSRDTLRGLARQGVTVIRPIYIPSAGGSFVNGETAYFVDDNGTGRVWRFREVLEVALIGDKV